MPSALPRPAAFFGRTTFDALYLLDALPAEDTKTFARAFHAAPGGPACNAAITSARLGTASTLFSAVGQGPWAAAIRETLAAHSIRLVDLAAGTAYETPLTSILGNASTATRTIINPPQQSVGLTELPSRWEPGWGAPPAIVLTDGFHLAETLPLLRHLHAGGIPLCLDGGSWKPHTEALLPLLSFAICSERFHPPGTPGTPPATLAWLAHHGVPASPSRAAVNRLWDWTKADPSPSKSRPCPPQTPSVPETSCTAHSVTSRPLGSPSRTPCAAPPPSPPAPARGWASNAGPARQPRHPTGPST